MEKQLHEPSTSPRHTISQLFHEFWMVFHRLIVRGKGLYHVFLGQIRDASHKMYQNVTCFQHISMVNLHLNIEFGHVIMIHQPPVTAILRDDSPILSCISTDDVRSWSMFLRFATN